MFSAGSLPPPRNSLVRPRQPPVPDGADAGRMVRHPFEGDGAVLAITFHGDGGGTSGGVGRDDLDDDGDAKADEDDGPPARADTAGRATTRFRYVRTNAFTNERKRGKKLYSGMESTRAGGGGASSSPAASAGAAVGNDLPPPPFHRHHLLPGLNKMRKNTSNTRTVYFGRKLLSLWSGGLPYKLDALALSTDGRSQLGGVVKREDASMGGKAAIDSKRNRILFYGIDEEAGSSTLNLYEFNSKFQPIRDNDGVVRVKLPGLAMIHDFAVTENYAVFVQPVLKVNGMQFMLSKEPGKSVSLEAESSVREVFVSFSSGRDRVCMTGLPARHALSSSTKNPPHTHHSEFFANPMNYISLSLFRHHQLVHIVARAGSKNAGAMKSLQIPFDGSPDANLQFVNAYEEDGTIIFDAIRSSSDGVAARGGGGEGGGGSSAADSGSSTTQWPWASTLSEFRSTSTKKSLWRYKVDPRSGLVTKDCISNDQVYFGVVNVKFSGRKHRYVYAASGRMGEGVAPPQGIIKIDLDGRVNNNDDDAARVVESWFPEPYEFCGEPMYAPREGDGDDAEEDGGYLLTVLFNGREERSELLVLRANNVSSGPIARVPIGIAVPHGYHGCFAPSADDANWTYEEIERRAKLADKMETRGSMWNEVKSDFSGLGLRFDDMEEYFGDLM